LTLRTGRGMWHLICARVKVKIDSSGHIEELNSLLRWGPKFPVDGLYFKNYFVTLEYTPIARLLAYSLYSKIVDQNRQCEDVWD